MAFFVARLTSWYYEAVEYRLLQHAPFPAAVQDAAAVYAHVVHTYSHSDPRTAASSSKATSRTVTINNSPNPDTHSGKDESSSDTLLKVEDGNKQDTAGCPHSKACKIILIGDSAGGNLVLALARWIRDEAKLPSPDGLLLLSPSCDPCKLCFSSHCSLNIDDHRTISARIS